MSKINIRTLLSDTVSATKMKLGIDGFTWGEFYGKLNEAMNQADSFSKAFFEDGIIKLKTTGLTDDPITWNVPAGITKICDKRFKEYPGVGEIILPDSVVEIGEDAFYDCPNISKIVLGRGIKKIGDSAFADNNGDASAVENDIELLGENVEFCVSAFSQRKIKKITIGKGATLARYAFANCTTLKTVIFLGTPNFEDDCVFWYAPIERLDFSDCDSIPVYPPHNANNTANRALGISSLLLQIIVPAALLDDWKTAAGWSNYADYIVAAESEGTT